MRPIRIAVTSDLHLGLTRKEVIREMCARLVAEEPDVVILAGDLGEGHRARRRLFNIIRSTVPAGIPVGVLAGNHDLWHREGGMSTQELWERALPELTREFGFVWLEDEVIRKGSVAVVGSLVWYDYSAARDYNEHTSASYRDMKHLFNRDGRNIRWSLTDQEFAARLREPFVARLAAAEQDPLVSDIVVVTHVPLFEAQMERRPWDPTWDHEAAYFGNFTTGKEVLQFGKVREAVSGHTHIGRDVLIQRVDMRPVRAHVIGSDYGAPAYVLIEVPQTP